MPPRARRTPCIADDHSPTTAAYRRGCSCPGARQAWREASADYKARRRDPNYLGVRGAGPTLPVTPAERAERHENLRQRNQRLAVGVRRKLRALMRIGHPRALLAAELDMTPDRLSAICGGSSGSGVWPKTAEAADELYRRLRYTLGDNDATATNAERLGYLPPQAWDGVDIDDPAALPLWRSGAAPRSASA